ncbi:unnamed protein product [Debaryomyces fabryi]|nr:unnamed protein product [Debaryomyces fabryi]
MSFAVMVVVAHPTCPCNSWASFSIIWNNWRLLSSLSVLESANPYFVCKSFRYDSSEYAIPYTMGPNTGPLPASSTPSTTGAVISASISRGIREWYVEESKFNGLSMLVIDGGTQASLPGPFSG